jgi:hypothetical protein
MDSLNQLHIDAIQVVLFYLLELEHLDLLMLIAPTNPSSTRSRSGSSLAENTRSLIIELRPVQYVRCHDTNTIRYIHIMIKVHNQ